MSLNWKGGFRSMLQGVQMDYRAAKEDQREFERQQKMAQTQMAKEKEMYSWKRKKQVEQRGEDWQWEKDKAGALGEVQRGQSKLSREQELQMRRDEGMKGGLEGEALEEYVLTGKIPKKAPVKGITPANKLEASKQATAAAKNAWEAMAPNEQEMMAQKYGSVANAQRYLEENAYATIMGRLGGSVDKPQRKIRWSDKLAERFESMTPEQRAEAMTLLSEEDQEKAKAHLSKKKEKPQKDKGDGIRSMLQYDKMTPGAQAGVDAAVGMLEGGRTPASDSAWRPIQFLRTGI